MSFIDRTRVVPDGLRADGFALRPITAGDAARDHAAVMETRDELRVWEQSSWPADDFTIEANRADLEDLEHRHAERRAFTYTVVDPDDTECLGCVYLFPVDARFLAASTVTAVGDAAWDQVEVVAYFWARASRIGSGLEQRLLSALRGWLRDEWGFERIVFVTNERFTRQVALLESSGLRELFELDEPDKPGTYVVYG